MSHETEVAAGGAPAAAEAGTASGPGSFSLGRVADLLERYGLVVLLAAEIVFFAVWGKTSHSFFTLLDFRTIAENYAALAIVALATIVPLIGGGFDLSVGAVALLGTIACAAATSHFRAPLGVAVLVAVVLGTAVGLVNGTVVAKLGVTALITTLGTFYVIFGIVYSYTGGNSIVTGIPTSLTSINVKTWLGVPRITVFMVIAALVVWYLLTQTPWGRHLHAVGSNPAAARLVGVRVDRVVLTSFMVSGAFAAVAGVLQLANTGNASPDINNAFGLVLPALASAFLGATTIQPGRFNVPGTLVGVFLIAVANQGLTLAGFTEWVQYVLFGAALVVAVATSSIVRRQRGRS